MGEHSLYRRAMDWLCTRFAYVAYRLIWLGAKTGNPTARDIYRAMWDANLDLPKLNKDSPA